MKVSRSAAYGIMVVAAIMWATSGTFTELAYREGVTVLEAAAFQMILAAMILLPLITVFDPKSLRLKREDFLPMLVFSVITGTMFTLAWFVCIDLTNVATTVILLYLYPSIVTIASVSVLGEKMSRGKLVALPLTFVGCVLVAGAQDLSEGLSFNLLGIGAGVFTAVSAAIYYLWGKKFLDKYSANTVILYMTALSVPGLVIVANPFDLASASISAAGWGYILALAVFPSTIGFVLSMIALRYIEASRASIVASIEPVAATAIAVVVLAETVNSVQSVGIGLVFLGVLLLRLKSVVPDGKAEEVILER